MKKHNVTMHTADYSAKRIWAWLKQYMNSGDSVHVALVVGEQQLGYDDFYNVVLGYDNLRMELYCPLWSNPSPVTLAAEGPSGLWRRSA